MKAHAASKILRHAWVSDGFSELLTSLVENDVYTLHVGALQWAALLVYRGLCCSLWFWLGYFGKNVTWHARVTPLAMGGWGNAIMLRPINCYLLRQTDFFKKNWLFTLLCCNYLFVPWFVPNTWKKSPEFLPNHLSNVFFLFVCFARVFTWIMFSNQLARSDLWPPRHQRSVFPIFPKSKSQQIGSSL